MGNIFAILQEIFMMKENNSTKIGLTEFKQNPYSEQKVQKKKKEPVAKELKISDLMRRSSY